MPQVFYPFAETHQHAGRFYKGWMPAGDVPGLLKSTGARLAEPSPETDEAPWSPKKNDVVGEAEVIADELELALEDWNEIKTALAGYGKAATNRATTRQVTVGEKNVREALKQGDAGVVSARRLLEGLEQVILATSNSVAQMLPATMPERTAVPAPEPKPDK